MNNKCLRLLVCPAIIGLVYTAIYFLCLFSTGQMSLVYDTAVVRLMATGDMIGYPNSHVLFTNYVFGYILSILYKILPVWNWYSMLLLFAMYSGLWAVIYQVETLLVESKLYLRLVCGILVVFLFHYFFFSNLMEIYFLNTSLIAGVCACVYVFFCHELRIRDVVIIWILLVLCAGLRFSVFKELLPFLLVAFFGRYLFLKYRRNTVPLILCAVIAVGAMYVLENNAYTGIYANEKGTNHYRSLMQDYGKWLPFEEYEDFYLSLDMDEDEYNIMRDCWGLSEHYNVETLSAIVERYDADYFEMDDKIEQVKTLLINMFKVDYKPTFWWMEFFAALFCILLIIRRRDWEIMLCYIAVWLGIAVELTYLAYRGRFPVRVTMGPLLILMLYGISYEVQYGRELAGFIKSSKLARLVVLAGVIICTFGVYSESAETRSSFEERFQSTVSDELAMVRYVLNDRDNVYFMHGLHDTLDLYNPVKRNYTGWGGWASGTLDWKVMLQGEYDSIWDAIANRGDLRFVVGENTVNTMLEYMEHLGYEVKSEYENVAVGSNGKQYVVWRFLPKTEADYIEEEKAEQIAKLFEDVSTAEEYDYSYDFHSNVQYDERLSIYNVNKSDADILFAGDSITQKFPIDEYFKGFSVLNRGIGSDVSAGLLDRMDEIRGHHPKKIFIMIGTNDIGKHIDPMETAENVKNCIQACKDNGSEVYLMSILPIVESEGRVGVNAKAARLNEAYKLLCESEDITYIDLYGLFLNSDGNPNTENYGPDGTHLNANGYQIIYDILLPYVSE